VFSLGKTHKTSQYHSNWQPQLQQQQEHIQMHERISAEHVDHGLQLITLTVAQKMS
jgi:hypothetical protein